MTIFCSLPVALSFAETFRMPLASMSKVTSICGMPRGAGRMPSRMKRASDLFSPAIGRSPWRTWTSTRVWPSAAVVNVSLLLVGMVVLRGISGVITPPSVSMPSVSGVTSSSRMSLTSPVEDAGLDRRADRHDLVRVDALVRLLAEHLLDLLLTTAGMRVWPPTRTTSSIWLGSRPASRRAARHGPTVRSTRSAVNCSSLRAGQRQRQVLRAGASAVMKGRLSSVCRVVESSIFAFSAASFRRWRAILSWRSRCPGPCGTRRRPTR